MRAYPPILAVLAFIMVVALTPLAKVQAAPPNTLYLTFDDGPSERYTPRILDVLKQKHVHATFFVLGSRCQEFPTIVARIQKEGHEVGNHGYDHRDLSHQPSTVVMTEIRMADSTISRVIGSKPRYYRPTYGALDRREIPRIQKMGHPVMYWTVDSVDWSATSAADIVQTVERGIRPGAIILFHDGISNSKYTAQALPLVIEYAKAHGYIFRTL